MYQDDYLLRQIRMFVNGLAGIQDEDAQEFDVDAALQSLCGLGVETLDSLPAGAVFALLTANEHNAFERVNAVADYLEAMSANETYLSDRRFAKAQALRTKLGPRASGV